MIPHIILAILLSMLPVSELRGGIPYALSAGLPYAWAFIICVAANIVVIPLIFLFLDHLHNNLIRFRFYQKTSNVFLMRIRREEGKIKSRLRRHGFIALVPLVAIPWPLTGAWTGSLIAWLFNLDRKKSLIAIATGVFIAGVIVILIAFGIIKIFSL